MPIAVSSQEDRARNRFLSLLPVQKSYSILRKCIFANKQMLRSRMLSHHFHFSSVMSCIPRMSLWRHPYHILIKGLAESALWTSRKLCSAWCMRYCWLHRYEETLVTTLPSPVFILSCRVRLATCYCPAVTTECCRLKDDGDGLTGPQPSILGSVDKVFNKVNTFDQYQCLQVLTNT